MASRYDAIVIGSGPNGLTAAALLGRAGLGVLVVEAHDQLGGGTRTTELTLPGFHHDVCSAVHTMGCLSPAFSSLQLEQAGLQWIHPPLSVAHPLDDGPGVSLAASVADTAAQFPSDAKKYARLIEPFLELGPSLFRDVLAPLQFPRHPLALLRLGALGIWGATFFSKGIFSQSQPRALLAGCAAHSCLPLSRAMTTAVGLVFLIAGHNRTWPIARGGSQSIARALCRVAGEAGVEFRTGHEVSSLQQLPPADCYLFDTSPHQLAEIAGEQLPAGFVRRLRRYRMGPGVFKVDWALSGSIPWRNADHVRASTVHLGGTIEEIAEAEARVWKGQHPERPFVILTQQSEFDPSRAPDGKHTGYAYCHVPPGSTLDMTAAIENQVERFAPGFKDLILARHSHAPADWERYNPSFHGGAITGGVADIRQLFARPTLRWNPYTTPNPQLFLTSQSTPPGGGVHGMCGFYAARAVLQRLGKLQDFPPRSMGAGALG